MHYLKDLEQNRDTPELEEEKSYMQAVSMSVSQMGKWCLSLYKPADLVAAVGTDASAIDDPFSDPSSR